MEKFQHNFLKIIGRYTRCQFIKLDVIEVFRFGLGDVYKIDG